MPCLSVWVDLSNGNLEPGSDFILLSDFQEAQKKLNVDQLVRLSENQSKTLIAITQNEPYSVNVPLMFEKEKKHKLFFVR